MEQTANINAKTESGIVYQIFASLGGLRRATESTNQVKENDDCSLPGVVCTLNSVSALNINWKRFNLKGALPDDISSLKSLSRLNLAKNQIDGKIPRSLCQIGTLTALDFSENNFSEDLPDCLNNLRALTTLNVQKNLLTGILPTTINAWPLLQRLDLSDNDFTGTIPANIGSATNLKYLSLAQNILQGAIPDSICDLTKLEYLDLTVNVLTKNIPRKIGALTELKTLWLHGNKLEGIPASLSALNLNPITGLKLFPNEMTLQPYDISNGFTVKSSAESDLVLKAFMNMGGTTKKSNGCELPGVSCTPDQSVLEIYWVEL